MTGEPYPSESEYRGSAVEPALDSLGFPWYSETYQSDTQMFADYMLFTPMCRFGVECGNNPREVAVEVGQSVIYAGPLPNAVPLVIVPPPAEGDEVAFERVRHVRERVPVWMVQP